MESPEKDWIAFDFGQVGDVLGVRSSRMSKRFNQINCVRANGIGDHIALPQLVLCSNQSTKKIVLERVTGICFFPRQDNFCTRFATKNHFFGTILMSIERWRQSYHMPLAKKKKPV
jgi:hypothetical protein